MTDLLAAGMTWLTSQLQANASETVTYKRGLQTATVQATVGTTLMKWDDAQGHERLEYTDRDFLIPVASLLFGSMPVIPARGDQVIEVTGGHTYTYEVRTPSGEQPWRYSDPYRVTYRIHTKLISTV